VDPDHGTRAHPPYGRTNTARPSRIWTPLVLSDHVDVEVCVLVLLLLLVSWKYSRARSAPTC
jgi:hypothetical protein